LPFIFGGLVRIGSQTLLMLGEYEKQKASNDT